MLNNELQLNLESLKTELIAYEDKPYKCLFEYIWNSFDASATVVKINYKLPKLGFGYIGEIVIEDNGKGWNFEKEKNTRTFLSSSKQSENNKNKSLPKGKFGRARYVFIWIADYLEIFSAGQKLELKQDTKVNPIIDKTAPIVGTKVFFHKPNSDFSDILSSEETLLRELVLEFCWFLKENPSFAIIINDKKVDFQTNIKKEEILTKKDFDEDIKKYLNSDFQVNIVLWNKKPSEWSSFYFIDEDNREIFTDTTRMNKKSDDFWHSVYIKSNLFQGGEIEDDETIEKQLDFGDKEKNKIKNKIIKAIKQKLVGLRKPYLIEQSNLVISDLKEDNLIPNLHEFGIYDEKSYEDLLKTIYTISPSLFVGRDKKEKKFICTTFAGLLSTQDNNLIKIILEQLQDLTESEKQDLLDILRRTSLSNVVRTIKEIDNRLQVIDDLEKLLYEYKKETLEVKHLQKMLNKNFWIFGEQLRLFRNTEGALKKTLFDYAKEILQIDNPEIITDSRKEVDLFLVKIENTSENYKRNIIVEIKRPSKKLGKIGYDQIEEYARTVKKESICNGDNQYWEFYLIGSDYDDYIIDKINNAKNHGEKNRGLVSNPDNGRFKIYVRKWSDILQIEWGYKMKFLKEKLEIKAKNFDYQSPDDIIDDSFKI